MGNPFPPPKHEGPLPPLALVRARLALAQEMVSLVHDQTRDDAQAGRACAYAVLVLETLSTYLQPRCGA